MTDYGDPYEIVHNRGAAHTKWDAKMSATHTTDFTSFTCAIQLVVISPLTEVS